MGGMGMAGKNGTPWGGPPPQHPLGGDFHGVHGNLGFRPQQQSVPRELTAPKWAFQNINVADINSRGNSSGNIESSPKSSPKNASMGNATPSCSPRSSPKNSSSSKTGSKTGKKLNFSAIPQHRRFHGTIVDLLNPADGSRLSNAKDFTSDGQTGPQLLHPHDSTTGAAEHEIDTPADPILVIEVWENAFPRADMIDDTPVEPDASPITPHDQRLPACVADCIRSKKLSVLGLRKPVIDQIQLMEVEVGPVIDQMQLIEVEVESSFF